MLSFVLRRLLWTIPVLLLTIFLTLLLVRQLPIAYSNNIKMSEATRKNIIHMLGLDQPLWKHYLLYVRDIGTGDLGISAKAGFPSVKSTMQDTLPVTMTLGLCSFIFAFLVGAVMGVVSALRANKPIDWVITVISTFFFAVPIFVICLYAVEWFPDWTIGWTTTQSKVGPIVVLGLSVMPYFSRVVRASMLETLQAEFVTTARSKGLRWRTTVVRHVFRNSLIPAVTNAGPLLGFLLTGSFIIERIMNVPGVASIFVDSFSEPVDTAMILASTVLVSVLIVMANLVVDITVAWLDPRITND